MASSQQYGNIHGGGVCPAEANEYSQRYFSTPTTNEPDEEEISVNETFPFEIDDEVDVFENDEVVVNDEEKDTDAERNGAKNEAKENCACDQKCYDKFPQDMIIRSRLDALDLSNRCDEHISHKHVLLMGAFNALCVADSTLSKGGSKDYKQRERSRVHYQFRGVNVCKKFFSFVNGVSAGAVDLVRTQFLQNGITPTSHGNVVKTSLAKALPLSTVQDIVKFINNFATNHGLVLPGRFGSYKNPNLKLLPCSMTKIHVFEQYQKSAVSSGRPHVAVSTFNKIWREFCANVVIQKPRTDLCAECQRNVISLGKMAGMNEEEKLALIQRSETHLLEAKESRQAYRQVCESTMVEIKKCLVSLVFGPHLPCSYLGIVHYSFDYLQSVLLPFSPQQVGPMHFLAGYKVALFVICCESIGKCIIYGIPECVKTGKGSNMVISMIHHFLEHFGLGEERAHFHADNCSGQNKNNYVVQYFLWRIMKGLHKQIDLSFLKVGHTKFDPDMYGGIFKNRFSVSDVSSLEDMDRVTKESCRLSNCIDFHLVGDLDGTVKVQSYDWQTFFGSFKPQKVPSISEVSHMEFSVDSPGKVTTRIGIQDKNPRTVQVFSSNLELSGSPDVTKPPGLSLERKKYLYDKIREYVPEENQDRLCPKLTTEEEEQLKGKKVKLLLETPPKEVGGPSPTASSLTISPSKPPPGKKMSRACSSCGQPGHKFKFRDRITCPNHRNYEPRGASKK